MSRLARWSVLSALAIVALVVGVLPPQGPPASAAVEESVSIPVEEVPGLPAGGIATDSPTAPVGEFTSPGPVVDESNLVPDLTIPESHTSEVSDDGAIDKDDLDVASRTETSILYSREGGGQVVRVSDDPLSARGADGSWQDISTSVEGTPDGWAVPVHPLAPEFANRADAEHAVTLTREGHEVSFGLVGAGAGRAEAPFWVWDDHDQLAFRDVADATDIEYEVQANGIKENVILKSPPRKTKNSWTWRLDVGALSPRMADATTLELVDDDGAVIYTVPSPMAWDSSGIEGERSHATTGLKVTLTKGASDWRYTVTASASWLASSDRVYPVTIDPIWHVGPSSRNAYKSDGAQFSGQLHVGNTREGNTNRYWRSVVGFDYGQVPGRFIAGAQLGIGYQAYNPDVQWGWVQHASCFGYHCMSDHIASYALGTGWAETQGSGVAQRLAQRFAIGDRPGWMIGGFEGSSYSHKQIDADIWIDYWDFPSVWTGSPGNDSTGHR